MKQIAFLMAAVFLIGVNCFAQNESKVKSLKDNITKSDVTIQHPKKGVDPKTWVDRGKFFHDLYNVNVGFLRQGMPITEAVLYFKEPKQIHKSDEGGVMREVYEYSLIRLNFENGALRTWEEKDPSFDNPLAEATNAYHKAETLDEKGKNAKKINEAYTAISRDLETKFFNEYFLTQHKVAHSTALQRIELNKLMNITDTVYYFFAGYAAFAQSEIDSSMWQTAIDYFEKALALKYREIGDSKGQIYDLLYNACMKIGNEDKALKYAQTGFEKHPEYVQLMYDLINFNLQHGETQKTLEYLDMAVAKDPNNPALRNAQGKMLDELGETEKAHAAYDAAIAANPNYFDAYYNKAVVYHNHAVILHDQAVEAKTNAEYETKKNLADEEFARSIPLFEKALELNPGERSAMETLKTLYFRLRTKYPEMEAKHDAMVKRLEQE